MNQTIFTKGKQCAAAPIFEYIIKDEMERVGVSQSEAMRILIALKSPFLSLNRQ